MPRKMQDGLYAKTGGRTRGNDWWISWPQIQGLGLVGRGGSLLVGAGMAEDGPYTVLCYCTYSSLESRRSRGQTTWGIAGWSRNLVAAVLLCNCMKQATRTTVGTCR